jgi:hypothetical protein
MHELALACFLQELSSEQAFSSILGGSIMKLKFVAAAAAVVFSSAGAFATTTDLGNLAASASFARTVAAGSFMDSWSFNLGTPSIVAASATNVEITFGGFSFGGISDFAATLNGVPLLLQSLGSSANGVTVTTQVLAGGTSLPAGTFSLMVSGTAAVGGASYGGNLVATPVPEPETYAMMLAGLGALGFLARRRRND